MTIKELERKVRLFDEFASYGYQSMELYEDIYQLFVDSKFVGFKHWEDCAVAVLPILTANAENRRESGVGIDPWLLFKALVKISETEKLVYRHEGEEED